ncbi:unnamed protein product [Haemonchus placei]|uniref:Uncharacterized protein n=1 Tax=Haemonchus placei TaxID=6290 RepID=A0A0N4VWJ2_HAEPC|nr:unnamed protein product [Haemonchus placei]
MSRHRRSYCLNHTATVVKTYLHRRQVDSQSIFLQSNTRWLMGLKVAQSMALQLLVMERVLDYSTMRRKNGFSVIRQSLCHSSMTRLGQEPDAAHCEFKFVISCFDLNGLAALR